MQKKQILLISLLCVIHFMALSQPKFHSPENQAGPEFEVKTVKLPTGVQLNYVEQGQEFGEPVIFLHGFTDSWRSYEIILPFLPPSIHVYAITQRGHGNSDKPAGSYDPAILAADVAAFIKELNIGPVVIVGHSMGATIAQRFVLDHPQLTSALVLIGAFTSFSDKPAMSEFAGFVNQLNDPVDPTFIYEFQKSTLAREIPAPQLDTYVTESMKLPAYVWKSVINDLMGADYRGDLKKISVPTLVVWGEKDSLAPEADQEILLNNIKRSSLIIYSNTGHAVHWEEPVRFANDLLNFINRHL